MFILFGFTYWFTNKPMNLLVNIFEYMSKVTMTKQPEFQYL